MENTHTRVVEHEEQLLGTEVFTLLSSESIPVSEMRDDLERVFDFFRNFESQFSRFQKESELSVLNRSTEMRVSEMLFDLLSRAQKWKQETAGRFDVGILPILESEGYRYSWKTGVSSDEDNEKNVALDLDACFEYELFPETRGVRKERAMKIDLGGIGKGYAVDHAKEMLAQKYQDFIVDAGGDMYIRGRDKRNNYDGFAIAIENPLHPSEDIEYVVLSGKAIATSGKNRRKWNRKGEEKHHLIDAIERKSSVSDILAVTVIADSVEEADIRAKQLFFLGSEKGMQMAEEKKKAVYFVCDDGRRKMTREFEKYVWKSE